MTVSTRTYTIWGRETFYGQTQRINDLDIKGAVNAIEIADFDPTEEYTIMVRDDRREQEAKLGERLSGFIGIATGPIFLDANLQPDYAHRAPVAFTMKPEWLDGAHAAHAADALARQGISLNA